MEVERGFKMRKLFFILFEFYLIHFSQGAFFVGPFDWSLVESTDTPDTPYCFETNPDGGVVAFDGQPSSRPTLHCIDCFGLWKDAGRNKYCLFFTPSATKRLDYDKAQEYIFPVTVDNGDDFATVNLKVIPDLPPFFTTGSNTATVTIPVSEAIDSTIFTIPVDDLESKPDLIYTLNTTNPFADFFYIDVGELKVKKNLANLCAATTELDVTVSDGFNPSIGPFKVQVNIDRGGASYKPIMATKDEIKVVDENKVGDFFYIFGEIVAGGRCIVTATPVSMAAQYTFSCNTDQVFATQSKDIDFETTPPVNYTIIYNNGFCDSDPLWYYLSWKDVPEVPKLDVSSHTFTVNEGFLNIQPNYTIKEEDNGDTHQYTLVSSTTPDITISTTTGALTSPAYYRLTNQASNTETVEVAVRDSTGLVSDPVTLTITILDINDNRPILDPYTTSYTFPDCTTSRLITTLTAQDDDHGVNAQVEFVPLTSGTMTLFSNGELWLRSSPVDGQVDVMTVRAKDNGSPSLTSLSGTISLVGTACGATTAPAAAATTTPGTGVTPITTTEQPGAAAASAASAGPFDDPVNIALLVLGIVLFLVIVAVSAYFIYNYCGTQRRSANVSRKITNTNTVNPYGKNNADTYNTEDNYGDMYYSKYNFDRGSSHKVIGKPATSSSLDSGIFWTEHYSDKSRSMPEPVTTF